MKKHVLILGAGFGGLELATRLSETMSDAVRVTLLDRKDSWYFGYSKLDVMLGRQSADDVRLYYSDVVKDAVEFRRETVTGIDPVARRVSTDVAAHDADYLVVAMGADYDMAATPGLQEGGHEYYTLAGAERLRDALQDFDGGRVLVSVLGQPFKCPPAPFEGAFMLHEHFKQRGMVDAVEISSVFPMQRPVPVTGEVAQMFRDGLVARGITELPEHLVTGIDPPTRTAQLANGEKLPYDLFIGIPKHRAPIHSQPPASRSTAGSRSTKRISRPSSPACTQSATSAPAPDRPQGRDLRRVSRDRCRRRHRGRNHGW